MSLIHHASPFSLLPSVNLLAPFTSLARHLSFSNLGALGYICTSLSPDVRIARTSVLYAMESAIAYGSLEIREGGSRYCFGNGGHNGDVVHIEVLNQNFWNRMLL